MGKIVNDEPKLQGIRKISSGRFYIATALASPYGREQCVRALVCVCQSGCWHTGRSIREIYSLVLLENRKTLCLVIAALVYRKKFSFSSKFCVRLLEQAYVQQEQQPPPAAAASKL